MKAWLLPKPEPETRSPAMLFRRRLNSLSQVFGLIALISAAGVAQENTGGRTGAELPRESDNSINKGSIRGRVVNPGGRFVSENIKVSLVTYRGVLAVTFTDARGGFDFTDLTPGNYEVQVETSGLEYQIVNQNVQVFKGMPSVITVPLNDKNSSTATRAGSVSVAELSADVPKAAKKEFEAANKAAANNRS